MLMAGVLKVEVAAGVFKEAKVADRVLSLLRERFDDAGETGVELGADMTPVIAGSVLREPPLSFALRLSARSLCSVKKFLSGSRRASSPGVRGARRYGEVTKTYIGPGTRNKSLIGSSMTVTGLRLCCVTRDGRGARQVASDGEWVQSVCSTSGECFEYTDGFND